MPLMPPPEAFLDPRRVLELTGFKPVDAPDIRGFIDGIAKQQPDLWRYVYPRFYARTDRYLSAKIPAQSFFMVSLDVLGIAKAPELQPDGSFKGVPVQPSLTEIAMFTALCRLGERRVPHFFIAPELLHAISLSIPPPELRWDEIHLPFEAAIFMLPRRTIHHPVNGEVAWVAYSRTPKEHRFDFHAGKHTWKRIAGSTSFTVCWECSEFRPNPPAFHMILNEHVNPHISTEDISACWDPARREQFNEASPLALPMTPDEDKFSEMLTSLVFRLLLAMDARPQLVSTGKCTGKRLASHHRPEIWTPNLVGSAYKIKSSSGLGQPGSGGWHTRMHWVRGHYKRQAYGPESKQRKMIWIEPYLSGIEK